MEDRDGGRKRKTPFYSPCAARVRSAIIEVSNNDLVMTKFADRLAYLMTLYETGFRRNGPIGSFLFLAPPEADLGILLETLAQEWFQGTTWDGRPGFFSIDCSGFTEHNPRVLIPLIGGPIFGEGQRGMFVSPQLGEITFPHFAVRAQKFLRDAANWNEWFTHEYEEDLNQLRRERKLEEFQNQLALIVEREQRNYYEELKKESPFLSVVVFEGVSRFTYPGLIALIKNIVQQGSITVWPNRIVDFSHSIVIVTTYDDELERRRGEMGFKTETESEDGNGESPSGEAARQRKRYAKGRRNLSETPALAGLVQAMGDRIFVVRNKRLSDQCAHVLSRLEDIRRRLEELEITIEWSEDFVKECAKDTRDDAFESYTDGRLRSVIDKHVLYQIAGQIFGGHIKRGACVYLNVHRTSDGRFQGLCEVREPGEGNALSASDIEQLWKLKSVGWEYFDHTLLETDERVKRINESAHALYKQISGV